MKFNLFLVKLNQEVNIFYDRTNCDGGGGGGGEILVVVI